MDNKETFKLIEQHLIYDEKPSLWLRDFIKGIDENNIFFILKQLELVQQDPEHHPEGDVLEHTMQVIDEAAIVKNEVLDKKAFMWAALLHDIGKEKTTLKRNGRWTAYDHDRVGAEMSHRLLREVSEDKEFNEMVSNMIKHHMSYLYVTKRLPFGDINSMIESTDIHDVALLTFCDRVGRGELSEVRRKKITDSLNDFIRIISKKTGEKYKEI